MRLAALLLLTSLFTTERPEFTEKIGQGSERSAPKDFFSVTSVSSVVNPPQDDAKAWVEGLGDKDVSKWKHAAYRLIEKGVDAAALKDAPSKSRAEMVLWEIRARKEKGESYPAYAFVSLAEGAHSLPDVIADFEKQSALKFDRQGFDRSMQDELTLDAALDRVPVLDALERVIGSRIMDFSSTRGRIRVWANTRSHSWRFGFGHTSVRTGSISWQRVNRFRGKVEESLSTSLYFIVDPRLVVGGAGNPVVLEAVDDTGAALEALPRDDGSRGGALRFKPPSEKATKIARLSGYVPYQMVTKAETIALDPPEKGKSVSAERGGWEIKVTPDLSAPKLRVEVKSKDPAAASVFPTRVTLVGKDDKEIEGTSDERDYPTRASAWDFTFAKLPDGFELKSIHVDWPAESVEMRAWFEFTDLAIK